MCTWCCEHDARHLLSHSIGRRYRRCARDDRITSLNTVLIATLCQQHGHGLSTRVGLYLIVSAIPQASFLGDLAMDHNRVEGTKHQIKGTAKEVTGKVTGNKAKEMAGKLEKNVGKFQKEVGKAADEQRDANKHQH
jgi:uncharacterized protein YjbJ (UPF0337 family)